MSVKPSMARYAFPVEALPGDVFENLSGFLTGVDLLCLSHVNARLLTEVLARDAPEWQRRAPPVTAAPGRSAIVTAKERYCVHQSRSVLFPGREVSKQPTSERGGAIDLWHGRMPRNVRVGSFSLDLWFALAPVNSTSEVYYGGIILGAQSTAWSNNRRPSNHQQLIHVDPKGSLYCSFLDEKITVAEQLQPGRWYHLAVTLDRHSSTRSKQRVYLDGDLWDEIIGTPCPEADRLAYGQLGNGYISGSALGTPTADFSGWYGFHGALKNCRLWDGVLLHDQVRRVAQSRRLVRTQSVRITSAMNATSRGLCGAACRVRCTRPVERVFSGQPRRSAHTESADKTSPPRDSTMGPVSSKRRRL